jgi:hypothetical protein
VLPFLKHPKIQQTGIAVEYRKPDEGKEESEHNHLEQCAQDLIEAVHSKDKKAVLNSLKDIFNELDAIPHIEGEHIEEEEQI